MHKTVGVIMGGKYSLFVIYIMLIFLCNDSISIQEVITSGGWNEVGSQSGRYKHWDTYAIENGEAGSSLWIHFDDSASFAFTSKNGKLNQLKFLQNGVERKTSNSDEWSKPYVFPVDSNDVWLFQTSSPGTTGGAWVAFPFAYEFRNARVSPMEGLSTTHFNYTTEFKASRSVNVGLFVFDIDSKKFKLVGKKQYKNESNWQKLDWPDVLLSNRSYSEGRSMYYFGLYENEDRDPFDDMASFNQSGGCYKDPYIYPIIIESAKVFPENGSNSQCYTYRINAMPLGYRSAMPISLEIYDPVAEQWFPAGTNDYNGEPNFNITMNLDKISLVDYFLGPMKSRIKAGNYSYEMVGPNIIFNIKHKYYDVTNRTSYCEIRASSSPLPFDIFVLKNGERQWKNDIKNYSSNGLWQQFSWTNTSKDGQVAEHRVGYD